MIYKSIRRKAYYLLREGFNLAGLDILLFPSDNDKRKMRLLHNHNIDMVIDVGANAGQYASGLRKLGYKGTIVSFEPLSGAFKLLQQTAAKSSNWAVHKMALGNENTTAEINIASFDQSSSFLEMNERTAEAAEGIAYVNKEQVIVKTLDSIWDEIVSPGKNVVLKIDAQGFEMNVLKGALRSIPKIKGIQLEMSVVELYTGETLYLEMMQYVTSLGFDLCSLETGFYNHNSGQLLQMDGIFYRS